MRRLKKLLKFGALSCLGLATWVGHAAEITVTTDSLALGETNYWTSDNTYILDGYVYVRTNTVLVIEAGTVVKGKEEPSTAGEASSLFVTRGAKLYAEGTPTRPIIFTAEVDDVFDPEDMLIYENGLWGGVVVMGEAVLNSADNSSGNQANPIYEVYEGLPDTIVDGEALNRYGGNDDDDDSGIIRYVSIRHGGAPLPNTSNKEINGLSLGAVGRGTTVEYVEVYAGNDDGFEFFGGTVNTRCLVAAFCDDEPFDTDMGYSGKNQFWFAIQAPTVGDLIGENDGQHNSSVANPPAAPIANWTVRNYTAIGGGAGGVTGRFRIRENSAPNIVNSVFTEIPTEALTIDASSERLMTNTFKIENNYWWNFNNNQNTAEAAAPEGDAGRAPFTNDWNNVIADPKLRGISYVEDGELDPRPAADSPLWNAALASSDSFFEHVDYVGAFGDDLWYNHWTALYTYYITAWNGDSEYITVTTDDIPQGETTTWYRTNSYLLDGYVYVRTNSTLVIEPGTVIRGVESPTKTDETSSLFVTRGAKIIADGTEINPIIFTSEFDDLFDPEDLPIFQNNLWGGVVVMGEAVLNSADNSSGNQANPIYEVYEGLPDTIVDGEALNRYGGNDDDDDSGIIRYVSIRHGGAPLPNTNNKEINGLSLGAVGRGTTVEYVEVYAGNDDGFEFFGGTVNTRCLVAAFCDDEPFDTDMGYSGKNQFWFTIQGPTIGDLIGENDGQHNSSVANPPAAPIANWTVRNYTAIGGGAGGVTGRFRIRENSAPNIVNSVFTEIPTEALTIDASSERLMTNTFKIENNYWWNFNNNANTAEAAAPEGDAGRAPFTNDWNNVIADPELRGISYIADGNLDPRPDMDSPLLSAGIGTADSYFYDVAYVGAFGERNWASAWTALGAYGIITGEGGGKLTKSIAQPVAPVLSVGPGSSPDTIQVTFQGQGGAIYVLEYKTDLNTGTSWQPTGILGTEEGGTFTFDDIPTDQTKRFFQVSEGNPQN